MFFSQKKLFPKKYKHNITLLFYLVMILLALNISQAATYYVSTTGSDSNAGTISAPWKTIQTSLGKLKPGDILYIRAGTYAQSFSDEIVVKGAASQSIVITSYPGESPVIGHIILAAGSQYVKITRLSFDGSLGSNEDCIKIENNDDGTSNHIEISYNELKRCDMQGMLIGGEDYTVIGNYIHNTGGRREGDHGIYAWGRRWTISNNVITDSAACGIQFWPGLEDSTISHNTIVATGGSGIGLTGAGSSEGTYYGSSMPGTSKNNLIVNNIIAFQTNTVPSYHAGCSIVTFWGGTVGSGNIVRNNLMYGNALGNLNCQGGSDGLTIESNNKVADPLFVNRGPNAPDITSSGTSNGYPLLVNPPSGYDTVRDLHLKVGSPAIDVGVNAGAILDKDGNPRPQGTAWDIGAYEYVSGATLTGDVNQDGKVDVLDVQKLVNIILGIEPSVGSADVNKDGSVNVLDVQQVVNIILGV